MSCSHTDIPITPPRDNEPVSPIKISAGGALNHRKPNPAPNNAIKTIAISPTQAHNLIADMKKNLYFQLDKLKKKAAIMTGTIANPLIHQSNLQN